MAAAAELEAEGLLAVDMLDGGSTTGTRLDLHWDKMSSRSSVSGTVLLLLLLLVVSPTPK